MNLRPVTATVILIGLILTTPVVAETQVRFDGDVKLLSLSAQNSTDLKAGDPLVLKKSGSWIAERPGHVPVMVVVVDPNTTQAVDVNLHPVQSWAPPQVQAALNRGLEELTAAMIRIQGHLRVKDATAVIAELDQLQAKYPEVAYLEFFRANGLLLRGDRSGAVRSLKRALASHPNQPEGKQLLNQLEKGGE